MRVAAIGDNCIDIYPKLGKAYPTGNAVDFAVNMRKLDVPTSMVGITGRDANGTWMIEALAREGLDVSHFWPGDGPTAIAYLDMDGLECIHVRYEEGVLTGVRYTDEQIAFAAAHDLVHSSPWGHVDDHLEQIKAAGALVSFDYSSHLDWAVMAQSLPFVDYAFFSLRERREEAETLLRAAAATGPRVAVATLGPLGSIAWDGARFHYHGIVEADVVNTVGAGDSFIAGFMRAVLDSCPVDDCLQAGAQVAARVVSVFGPWVGSQVEAPR